MANTEADTEPAANQSGVDANEGAGRGNHCWSSGERVVENCVGLKGEKIDQMQPPDTMAVPSHPSGIVVKVMGIGMGDRGRSCEKHGVCGEVVEEDTLLCLQRVQKETAIACIWVTNGIDRCRVGFLKRHMLKHAWRFDGALAQVTKVFSSDPSHCDLAEQRMHHHNHGCALATVVSIANKPVEIEGKMPMKGEKRKAHEQGTRGGY
jgi:hypothetical protein